MVRSLIRVRGSVNHDRKALASHVGGLGRAGGLLLWKRTRRRCLSFGTVRVVLEEFLGTA